MIEAVADGLSTSLNAAPWRYDDARLSWSRSTWIAASLGIAVAAVAITLRLMLSTATGGEQTIFSFPAIVAATLLFGMRAGFVTALVCLAAWWYFVLPPAHSFAITGPAQAISILIYLFVAGALIWAIGGLRLALARAQVLAGMLEQLVARRTAERDHLWTGSREFVAIMTADGIVTAMNPALRGALASDRRSASILFSDLVDADDRPVVQAAMQRLGGEGAYETFEARLNGMDGDKWVEWTAKRELGQRYLVGRDVTAERNCSENLRQSQKMEMVGQMTGGIVHDFANLLSPITMVLDMLRQRHRHDSRTSGLIDAAQQSTGRAEMLVRRLLRFSRSERHEPRPRPVPLLSPPATPLLRQVLGRRTLDIAVAPNLPSVRVDANEFDLALLNLAVNARDATDEKGHIRLAVDRADRGAVEVVLTDNGVGMDAATLARAREPFFTTKDREHGTGLGLPMVHNFATGAGGALTLASEPGRGTTARIVLPTQDGEHA